MEGGGGGQRRENCLVRDRRHIYCMWTGQTLWMFLSLGVQQRGFIAFEKRRKNKAVGSELEDTSDVISQIDSKDADSAINLI